MLTEYQYIWGMRLHYVLHQIDSVPSVAKQGIILPLCVFEAKTNINLTQPTSCLTLLVLPVLKLYQQNVSIHDSFERAHPQNSNYGVAVSRSAVHLVY